jgi:hypothetical protein
MHQKAQRDSELRVRRQQQMNVAVFFHMQQTIFSPLTFFWQSHANWQTVFHCEKRGENEMFPTVVSILLKEYLGNVPNGNRKCITFIKGIVCHLERTYKHISPTQSWISTNMFVPTIWHWSWLLFLFIFFIYLPSVIISWWRKTHNVLFLFISPLFSR